MRLCSFGNPVICLSVCDLYGQSGIRVRIIFREFLDYFIYL